MVVCGCLGKSRVGIGLESTGVAIEDFQPHHHCIAITINSFTKSRSVKLNIITSLTGRMAFSHSLLCQGRHLLPANISTNMNRGLVNHLKKRLTGLLAMFHVPAMNFAKCVRVNLKENIAANANNRHGKKPFHIMSFKIFSRVEFRGEQQPAPNAGEIHEFGCS